MNIQRKNQASLILLSFTSLMKKFDFGLEIYKDELVTQITEDIIQGILNVISTYEQEV